ncbi:MAG TPA: hypothetical protein VFZ31_12765, partial [Vicinamibacterales bacterium]
MLTDTARTIARATLLALWLLPAAPALAFAHQPDNPPTPSERLRSAEWSLVRPTPMVTLHVRRMVGYAMLVPAGTLFMLYMFRPRAYVIAGATAWAAGSMMLLVLSFDSGAAGSADPNTITAGRLGVGGWSFAALIFGASLRLASGWFRGPSTISRSMFWAVIAAEVWVIFGAALLRRPGAILIPAF